MNDSFHLGSPPLQIREGKLELIRDAIMENEITESIQTALNEGEKLENVAQALVEHCCAYQQLVNLYGDWLEELGDLAEEEPPPEEDKKKKKGKKGRKRKNDEEIKEEQTSTSNELNQSAAPVNKALSVRTSFAEKGTDKKYWTTWQWMLQAQGKETIKRESTSGMLSPTSKKDPGLLSPPARRDSTAGILSPKSEKSTRRRTKSTDEAEPEAHTILKKEDSIEQEIFDGRAEAEKSVENTLATLVKKTFDQGAADALFSGGGGIDWLPELIKIRRWRILLYDLIEAYPNCLMLNFAVKLISDAGYQDEISNASTNLACGQLDIFTKVFVSTFDKVLREHRHGCRTRAYEKAFGYLVSIVCQNEHTYILVQCALSNLYNTLKGRKRAACRHVAEELRNALKDKDYESHSLLYSLMLTEEYIPDEIIIALLNMVSKRDLNPADIRHIYDDYITPRPVNIDVIRDFTLIDLLIDSLFHCEGPKVTIEHRDMYIYLLAYAGSVSETYRDKYKNTNRADFQDTREALTMAVAILENCDDLTRDLQILELADRPVVAMGILYYVHTLLLSENTLGDLPLVCLCFMDQLATHQRKLRGKILEICQELYTKVARSPEVAEIIMERQKLVLDRMIHLLAEGEVASVLEKVASWFADGEIDVSLVRYFITEILEMVMPPYSDLFKTYMLPLADDHVVFDETARKHFPVVLEFLRECGRLDEDDYPPPPAVAPPTPVTIQPPIKKPRV